MLSEQLTVIKHHGNSRRQDLYDANLRVRQLGAQREVETVQSCLRGAIVGNVRFGLNGEARGNGDDERRTTFSLSSVCELMADPGNRARSRERTLNFRKFGRKSTMSLMIET